jgi:hypothetical protein
MVAPNANFDTILATTLNKHRSKLTDNIFKRNVLSDRLLRKGRIEEDGGVKIIEPLLYAENDTVMAYSGWDRLDLTPQEGITAAEYEWKSFAGSVAIHGEDEDKNSGSAGLIKLVKAKVMQLEKSLAASLNRQLHGDYTGLTEAKSLTSLKAIVDSSGTIGGIDGGTYSWWRAIESDATADVAFDETRWATAFYAASNGIEGPTMGLTTVELFQLYEEELTPNLRYTSNNEGDSRFRNLMFKGVPLFFDPMCEAGTTYFVNEDNIKLVTHKKTWMRSTGFREVPDVDGKWSLVLSRGQLVTNERRGSAKIVNQSY